MQEEDELDLSDIEGLDPHIAELIQQKARDKAAQNRKHARAALITYDGLFCSMYCSLANFANFSSDSVWIYLRLFSITDNNQHIDIIRTSYKLTVSYFWFHQKCLG